MNQADIDSILTQAAIAAVHDLTLTNNNANWNDFQKILSLCNAEEIT